MSYYLQMDGVDDFIVTPSITCNKIEIDTIVRYRTSGAWNCMLSGVGHNATVNSSGGFSVSGYVAPPMIDGSNTYGLGTNNTRKLVTLTRTSLTAGAYYLFSNAGTKDYFAVDAYGVKFYNNETLVAHYDMSTGTVQDQSGNGNHATLVGGTWIQDIPRLQMNGVNDYIQTPSFSWDNVELDLSISPSGNQQKILSITSSEWGFIQESVRPSENWDVDTFNAVTVNDVAVTNNSNFIPENERITLRVNRVANTNVSSYLFAHRADSGFLKGDLYSAKFYLGNVLTAHYDTSTGTLQDQSGNGNHANLTGGTWIQDTPTNPDPIAVQSDFSTRQVISKQTIDNFSTKQTITKQTIDNFNIKQIIHKQTTSDFATNQIITTTSSYIADFTTKQIIHKQTTENIQTKQSIFKTTSIEIPTKQTIYKSAISDLSTKQILFKSAVIDNQMNLIIFRRTTVDVPTTQRITQEGVKEYNQEINLMFFINRSVDLDFKIIRKVPLTFKI